MTREGEAKQCGRASCMHLTQSRELLFFCSRRLGHCVFVVSPGFVQVAWPVSCRVNGQIRAGAGTFFVLRSKDADFGGRASANFS
ncbi:hypothetical protein APV28_0603 [Comamonas testosteroni]|nr:hypothetical protein APV28_0603 [Comamonas testosteroni]